MSATLSIRDLELGTGRPAVIVPLTGPDLEAVLDEAAALTGRPVDLVEWRIDRFLGDLADLEAYTAVVSDGARRLRAALDEAAEPGSAGLPLLLTLRTAAEGGDREIADAAYAQLLGTLCGEGAIDLVDVEVQRDREQVLRAIEAAHAAGVLVVGSNHDFARTPPMEEIVARLESMQELGVDVRKIAVMPQDAGDVLTLLQATWTAHQEEGGAPLITMSMGPLGVISRIAGGRFGSVATFGTVGAASAPGQVGIDELVAAMDVVGGEARG